MDEHDAPPLDIDAFCARLAKRTGVKALTVVDLGASDQRLHRESGQQLSPLPSQQRSQLSSRHQDTHSRAGVTPPPRHTLRWHSALSLGIGVSMVVCVAFGWWTGVHRMSTQLSTFRSIYTTAHGERATIRLPDGTTVVLNVASKLEVPASYAAGTRTVHLDGEALFTVAQRTGDPFVVVAGSATTRVLGTSFVVRNYPTDSVTTVAVRDGKVAVGATVLTASQGADVRPNGVVSERSTQPGEFTFAAGILTLSPMTFSRAVPELNRWYNADIQFGDPQLAHKRISGQFAAGSLADLTEYLALIYDIRVVRDGRVLTLYSR